MNKIQLNFTEKRILYPIFFLSAVLFLLAFSLWESPLYTHWYGCDASFFSMAGRGITQGWVPYVDFFDLKGPCFFFLEALGQSLFKDRLGVWLLEIPFLFASIVLIYEIGRLFVSHAKALAILCIVLFLHIGTLWGGNTLEEFMLPLNLLVIFLTLKQAQPAFDFTRLRWYVPYITGLSFGVILFSKVTVGAPIAGVVITVTLCLLLAGKRKELLSYLGLSFLGVLTVAAPLFLYFGFHHAIPEMLYCVFRFAFKRSLDYSERFNFEWEVKCAGCYFAFFLAILHPKRIKRPLFLLLLSTSISTWLLLHLGVPFLYYFTTMYPVLVLALAVFLDLYDPLVLFRNAKQFFCLFLLAVMLYFYAHSSLDTVNTFFFGRSVPWYENEYKSARDLAALIPDCDRDKVFCFNVDMTWFEANQMLPCNKYQINLPFFITLDANIQTDLILLLNETPPKWLVIKDSFRDELPSLFELVASKYDCISANDSGSLYLLRE